MTSKTNEYRWKLEEEYQNMIMQLHKKIHDINAENSRLLLERNKLCAEVTRLKVELNRYRYPLGLENNNDKKKTT